MQLPTVIVQLKQGRGHQGDPGRKSLTTALGEQQHESNCRLGRVVRIAAGLLGRLRRRLAARRGGSRRGTHLLLRCVAYASQHKCRRPDAVFGRPCEFFRVGVAATMLPTGIGVTARAGAPLARKRLGQILLHNGDQRKADAPEAPHQQHQRSGCPAGLSNCRTSPHRDHQGRFTKLLEPDGSLLRKNPNKAAQRIQPANTIGRPLSIIEPLHKR